MINKIKAEVKRLMNNRDSRLVDGSYFDFEHLLSFIESLEKEQKIADKVIEIAKPLTEEQKQAYETAQLKHLEEYKKWKEEREKAPKIKGWVARDDDLNHIHLFHNKPLRSKWTWACGYPALQLPDELFQDLKWEDEPIEVELTISRVIK